MPNCAWHNQGGHRVNSYRYIRSRRHLTDLSIYWRQLWEGTHDYFPTIRFIIGHLDLTIIDIFQRSLSIFKFLPPYFSLLPLTHLHLNLACHKEKNNPVISHHLLIFCEFLTLQGSNVKKLWVEKVHTHQLLWPASHLVESPTMETKQKLPKYLTHMTSVFMSVIWLFFVVVLDRIYVKTKFNVLFLK